MKVEKDKLRALVESASFAQNGDGYERQFGHVVTEHFPNCEVFWRLFVVPLTTRIEGYPDSLLPGELEALRFREDMDAKLIDISAKHYTMFLHLAAVQDHLNLPRRAMSWITDCYVHIVSACDLAESCLVMWYLLWLNLRGEESKSKIYIALKAKKKLDRLFKQPNRGFLLNEYLGNYWHSKYTDVTRPVRDFRNQVVHNAEVFKGIGKDGVIWIPKPLVIEQYQKWGEAAQAIKDPQKFPRDFVPAEDQIKADWVSVQEMLNKIWAAFLIPEIEREFYEREDSSLWKKYQLEEVSTSMPCINEDVSRVVDNSAGVHASGVAYAGGSAEWNMASSELDAINRTDIDDDLYEGSR